MYIYRKLAKSIILFLALTSPVLLFWPPPKKKSPFTIVTTTGIIGDIVTQIVNDKAEVTTIIQPSLNPHEYETTLKDIHAINKANMVIKNGLHLEGALDKDLDKLSATETNKVYSISDALAQKEIILTESGGIDPHIWFDVQLLIKATRYISKKIQEKDPSNASQYQQNTDKYIEKLQALEAFIKSTIKQIPKEKRLIVMPHNSFNYLRRYGFEIASLQGISTIAEPSLATRVKIVNQIKKQNIHAIFLETSTNNKGMFVLQQDCKKSGHHLQCHILYTDSLASQGEATSYIGMMTYNINTLKEALSNDTAN